MNIGKYGSNGQAQPKKAVMYLRVSTEEQVENYSLNTQEDICRREALKRGYEIIMMFREEGRSAKSIAGRPVLIKLLEYCRKNKKLIGAVFVYRIDRISRQTSDYLAIRKKLAEHDISIISASEPTGDSPTEKLVETILAGFAQLDNDIRSERAKNGLRARFLSGLISSPPPFGYLLKNGYAVKDPKTFDKVKKAWKLMATGTKSIQEMVEIMNSWGLKKKSPKGTHIITRTTLHRMFRSKFYIGVLVSKRYHEEVRGQHTPMITEKQYYKVQAILDGRNPNKVSLTHRVRDNPTFPLRRFAKCGKCGASLTGALSKGRNKRYAYYRCSKFCTGQSIRKVDLEDELNELLKSITPKEECIELCINFIQAEYYKRRSRLHKIRNEADNEIAKLYELRKQLVEKNLSGTYSDEIFKEQNAVIEDKILKAQIAKHDETFEKYDINKITDFMKTLLSDLEKAYKKSGIKQKKALLGSIFPSGITWSYPALSNPKIRPLYKAIYRCDHAAIPFGGGGGIRTHASLYSSRV